MRTLYVQPLGGLCNRMRVIVGAASLAKKLDQEMVVIWTRDATLNASFSELFEPIPYKVIDTRLSSFSQRTRMFCLKRLYGYNVLDDSWISSHARGRDFDEWKDNVIDKPLYINSNLDILLDGDYCIYHVKELLLREWNDICIDKNTIGVHIRRSDNVNAVKYSPTSLFIEKVCEEIAFKPDTTIYLATDDVKEELAFVEHFGDRVKIYKKHSLDRNNPYAIKDAVIDLYNLSQCKKIYGSYYSSFSDTAALWTGIDKIVLKVKQ